MPISRFSWESAPCSGALKPTSATTIWAAEGSTGPIRGSPRWRPSWGAISFVSAPAFVALKANGGLKWLAYELGVPLGLILVMVVLAPTYHRMGVVSIYEYLEQRFDAATRSVVSLFVLAGRGFATAVSVLAGGVLLSATLGIPTTVAILVIGGVTILYDVLGGIRVVIVSDVIQMLAIGAGIFLCGVAALSIVGWDAAWAALPPPTRSHAAPVHSRLPAAWADGFLFVAILAALMSSLDSGLNSLSALTVRDFYQRYWRKEAAPGHYLRVSKIATLGWGIFCVGFALAFAASPEATQQTTIVLVNKVTSIFYGPVLAGFLLGMLTRWAGPHAVKAGATAGVTTNLVLWQWTEVSWLWWNLTGFAVALAVAAVASLWDRAPRRQVKLEAARPSRIPWSLVYAGAGIYFVVILGISRVIERLA